MFLYELHDIISESISVNVTGKLAVEKVHHHS